MRTTAEKCGSAGSDVQTSPRPGVSSPGVQRTPACGSFFDIAPIALTPPTSGGRSASAEPRMGTFGSGHGDIGAMRLNLVPKVRAALPCQPRDPE